MEETNVALNDASSPPCVFPTLSRAHTLCLSPNSLVFGSLEPLKPLKLLPAKGVIPRLPGVLFCIKAIVRAGGALCAPGWGSPQVPDPQAHWLIGDSWGFQGQTLRVSHGVLKQLSPHGGV